MQNKKNVNANKIIYGMEIGVNIIHYVLEIEYLIRLQNNVFVHKDKFGMDLNVLFDHSAILEKNGMKIS